MARNHMTQLTVAVDVLTLLPSISTHNTGSNLLVHITEWHLEESEVHIFEHYGQDKPHSLIKKGAQLMFILCLVCQFSEIRLQEDC